MAIDLITGHQGVSHISADQIATINNAMMDNFGANKVMRLVGGELTADGLTITISEGYWRVNGFDMEIQEGETLYIDPTTIGLSRIDDIYVEILQDIPTGAQRAEIYIALGEPSATPTAPDEPTAPYLNTDILLQIIKLARVTVSEGAMIMEDYSVAYNIVTPEDLAEVQTEVETAETHATTALNMIRSFSNDDVYSTSKAYNVGDHVIYNNVIYKCITACSAGSWYVNKNCFEETTLTTAVTALNSDLMNIGIWTQLGNNYEYTPSAAGQAYLNATVLDSVPNNAKRVAIDVIQAGDMSTFVELAKGHTTNVFEFNGSRCIAAWVGSSVVISYANFVNTNKMTAKAYVVL